jgi:hypothetical protein
MKLHTRSCASHRSAGEEPSALLVDGFACLVAPSGHAWDWVAHAFAVRVRRDGRDDGVRGGSSSARVDGQAIVETTRGTNTARFDTIDALGRGTSRSVIESQSSSLRHRRFHQRGDVPTRFL